MNLLKSGLLGSATALVAAGSAFAADLPSRKSAPVEYVKVCDVYGRGFFYIPGTDTCLKIGARVRAQYSYIGKSNVFVPGVHSVSGAGVTTPGAMAMIGGNGRDQLGWYARGYAHFDARTQTAWGTVQTFMTLRVNSTSGHLSSGYNSYVNGNAFTPTLAAAYIRFAGFTFGRAKQIFEFMPSGVWGSKFAGTAYSSGVKQLAYTASFGGGLSATVGLEDMRDYNYDRVAALGGITGGAFQRGGVRAVNGPSRLPSLVANVRLEQGWGAFQVMGAVQQYTANISAPGAFAIANNGPLVKQTGYAVGSGLQINLPMLAQGDRIFFLVGYARGALGHILEDYTSAPGGSRDVTNGLQRRDNAIYVYGVGGTAGLAPGALSSEMTTGLQFATQLIHYWTPTLRSNFHVSYARITPGVQTRNTDWSKGGLSRVTGLATTANLIWTPVRGFDIGAEVGYVNLKQRLTGDNGGAPSPIPVAFAGQGFKTNTSGWEFRIRVQRDY
jgi:hypothetical protein